MCDSELNVTVDLGCMKGVIPREEAALCCDGTQVKDIAIITRVGKPVCVTVMSIGKDFYGQPVAHLSRRAAQNIMADIAQGNQGVVTGSEPVYNMGTVPLPKGIRTEIRSTLQDVYFVLKKPEKFEKTYKRFTEILTDLENTDYQLTSDYIEAKSLATVAQEIMLEVTRKHQEDY